MRVMKPGHNYALKHLDGPGHSYLDFVYRGRHNGTDKNIEGVTNQEVLRALIDRIQFLDKQLPHRNNALIVYHLRMALVLHESRALERKVEKGELDPETVATGEDQHFKLKGTNNGK